MKSKGVAVDLSRNTPGFTLPTNIGELGDDSTTLNLFELSLADMQSATQCHQRGIAAADMFSADYSAKGLHDAGYSLQECLDAGYAAQDLAGTELEPCFAAVDWLHAGKTAADIFHAGYTAMQARDGGFLTRDCKKAGYSFSDLYDLCGPDLQPPMVSIMNACAVGDTVMPENKFGQIVKSSGRFVNIKYDDNSSNTANAGSVTTFGGYLYGAESNDLELGKDILVRPVMFDYDEDDGGGGAAARGADLGDSVPSKWHCSR